MFKKSNFKKLKDQGNIVLKSKLLADLTLTERYELLQLCHRRRYKEGEFIFYQNDPGAGMYFIEEGKVQLIVTNGGEDPDAERFTVDIEAPSEFGIMSISYEIRRMSSAKCLTDCTILGFFKPDFETLKKRHPETAVKFLEAVSTQTMKQLELTMRKLRDVADMKTAFTIQFESQYKNDQSDD